MHYIPRLNDYVKWTNSLGHIVEGWVYFCDEEYISIEIGVKDKPPCQYSKEHRHKKIHILVVCYNQFWHQLEYIKSRESE
jgi:hypothetical protein